MPRQPPKTTEPAKSRLCTSCNRVRKTTQFELFKDGNYRGVCRDCVLAQRAKKTSATPESYLRIVYTQLRSQRRKQGIEFPLTLEELHQMWETQEGHCALSGILMTHHRDGALGDRRQKEFNASIDRINPQGPYSRENVQIVAARVNTMKHTLGEEMFMWWVRNIYEHQIK